MLRKRPGASAFAIIALALGIGLTSTMFSIVEGVILRGLPYEESDRLVAILRRRTNNPASRQSVPLHDFVDWRARQTSLEPLAAYLEASAIVSGDTAWPEHARAVRITPNLMAVLRITPALGRDLTESDAAAGAPAAALISHALWQSRLGGRADAVGSFIRLNGTPTAVVGVLPPKSGFPGTAEIWMPLVIELPSRRDDGAFVNVVGRLQPDVGIDQASAELAVIAGQLAAAHPENRDVTAHVTPLVAEAIPSHIRRTFYTMLAAVIGVMLIACVNVANMQLARAAERTGEFAIRTALGSSGSRLVRQALAEGLLLAGCGAAIGLVLAHFGAAYVMTAIAETEPPFWIDIRVDAAVLAFAIAITMAATLASSIVPGLRASRIDANDALKSHARPGAGVDLGRFGRWLVVVEIAVSCALLVVSGLMIRTIVVTSRLGLPFTTTDVLFAEARLDERDYRDPPAVRRAATALETQIASVPGVQRAAVATSAPGATSVTSFSVEGVATAGAPGAARVTVGPSYFDVLGAEVREGRRFAASDDDGAPRVAVVDDVFAAKYLAGRAIGRRIRFDGGGESWLTVVGVVPSLARHADTGGTVATVYVPFAQAPARDVVVLARTAGDPMTLAPLVRAAVAQALPDTPLANLNSLAGEYWKRGWAARLFGGLFLAFGASALFLAAAGLYGVMAFAVRRRTYEIGVRMALGASQRTVLGLVIRQGLWRVALGIAIGLWPGWLLAVLMKELLGDLPVADPIVYAGAAMVLLASGLLATIVPALRASSITPLSALRAD